MMRKIIVEDNAKEDGGGDEGYVFETSSDLKEYVAVQKIPSYGVHCYMAVSDEPMTKWNKVRSKFSKIPARAHGANITSLLGRCRTDGKVFIHNTMQLILVESTTLCSYVHEVMLC